MLTNGRRVKTRNLDSYNSFFQTVTDGYLGIAACSTQELEMDQRQAGKRCHRRVGWWCWNFLKRYPRTWRNGKSNPCSWSSHEHHLRLLMYRSEHHIKPKQSVNNTVHEEFGSLSKMHSSGLVDPMIWYPTSFSRSKTCAELKLEPWDYLKSQQNLVRVGVVNVSPRTQNARI